MFSREETHSGIMVRECLAHLVDEFPLAFGAAPQPLKVGVARDAYEMLQGRYGRKVVETAIGRHVRTKAYLEAVVVAQHRIDLFGRHAGRLTEQERTHARQMLDEMACAEADGGDGLAKKARAELLRRFEASKRPLVEFADLVQLDHLDLKARLDRALREREERLEEAKKLVAQWRASGLSRNQFCREARIKPRKLETALERAGAAHPSARP